MPDNGQSLHEKLSSWLLKSGYPLEMKAAALVKSHNFLTFRSEYYFDRESREMREIDVVGVLESELGEGILRVTIAIECKSSRDKPWVVLAHDTRGRLRGHVTDRASSKIGDRFLMAISGRQDVQEFPIFRHPERVGYSVIRGFGDGPDVPYGAMMTACKAAESIAWEASGPKATPAAELVLPVIVLEGDLFEYSLSHLGEPVLRDVRRHVVYWRNPIAGKIHSVITVSTIQDLPAYLDEVRDSFNRLCAECRVELAQAFASASSTDV
jgi:hypothetical protein